jgi:TPR repeat protein
MNGVLAQEPSSLAPIPGSDELFDPNGRAIKCYVVTRDDIVFGVRAGIDPATGHECRPVTPQIVERIQKYKGGNRPKRITEADPTFFDPRTGEPSVWYFKNKEGNIELFDLMGFHLETGNELVPITKEVVENWKTQKQIADRLPPNRIDPKIHPFFDPVTGKARVWYLRTESGDYEFYDRPGFNPRTGEPLAAIDTIVISEWQRHETDKASPKCYVITKESVSYGNRPGIDAVTGRQCRPLTIELLERLREYERGNRANRITKSDPIFFDLRNGEPIVWYAKSRDGSIELFDLMGFHPDTGEELLPVTKEIVENWKAQSTECGRTSNRQVPQLVDPLQYQFFDPITGGQRGWYWRSEKGVWEFYNSCGFHPRTGDPLLVATKEVLERWLKEADDIRKQKDDEALKLAEEKRKQATADALAKSKRDAELASQLLEQTESAKHCDELAGNPTDPNRSGNGAPYDRLKSQAKAAIMNCENAMKRYPTELRFKYQMARALQFVDRRKALTIHQELVRSAYPAAHDNLGWLIITERKSHQEAVSVFRSGVQLGDPDSMVSLAEMYDRGYATPRNQNETKFELYSRAAQLGHPNAIKALQIEEAAERQKTVQEEQQRRAMEMMRLILQNVPRR